MNHVLLHVGSRHTAAPKPHGERTCYSIKATEDVLPCDAGVVKSVKVCVRGGGGACMQAGLCQVYGVGFNF